MDAAPLRRGDLHPSRQAREGSMQAALQRLFYLEERGTNIRTEVIAGLTTFVTVAYILAVNPSVLAQSGMDSGAVFTATAVVTFIGTCLMGLMTNYPFILGPSLGLNAYFAYTVCLGMGYSWQVGLAACFVEGLIFLLLSVTKLRDLVFNAIPQSLKLAITAGIGLFVALIGLKGAGIIVGNDATLVGLFNIHESLADGSFSTAGISVVLALVGVIITGILSSKHVKGDILLGILITWALGIVCQLAGVYVPDPAAGFNSVLPDFSRGLSVPSLAPTFMQLDFSHITDLGFLTVVMAILFASLFDTVGTLVGAASKAGLLDEDGNLAHTKGALVAESLTTMVAAVFGNSPTCVSVECAAGITSGGRTGLTSITVAVMFVLSLLLSPFFLAIPMFATAPALIMVGFSMMGALFGVDFGNVCEGLPAFVCAIAMPFTYSIAEGICLGIIVYVVVNLAAGEERRRTISPMMYALAVLFVLKYLVI